MSTKSLTIRMDDKLLQDVKELSERTKRSMSNMVEVLIEVGLDYYPEHQTKAIADLERVKSKSHQDDDDEATEPHFGKQKISG